MVQQSLSTGASFPLIFILNESSAFFRGVIPSRPNLVGLDDAFFHVSGEEARVSRWEVAKCRDSVICPFEVVLGLLLSSEYLVFGQPVEHDFTSSLNPSISPLERAESLCRAFSVTGDKIHQAAYVGSLAAEK